MRKKIAVKDLQVNTVIANDVYNERFQLIITKGTLLSIKLLDRLKIFGVEYVYIDTDSDIKPAQNDDFLHTPEFEGFKKKYLNITDSLQNSLNKIIERSFSAKELEDMVSGCLSLYNSSDTSLGIFDMLNHMKTFSDVTYVHSINVGIISAIIGRWSGKSPEDEKILIACGLLHDIGKLLIPEEILNKPGRLTPEEFEVIKTHTTNGFSYLQDLPIDDHIKQCALMHHEKLDGSGYPRGLTTNQIDDFAKIVTIADIFDALTANRVYRGAICPFDVIELFEKDGFQLYDTKYLMTFLQHIINTYLHTEVTLTNGTKGEIIMINTNNLSKPVILSPDGFVDLSKNTDIKIEKLLLD